MDCAGHNMILTFFFYIAFQLCGYVHECRFPPRPERVLGPLEEQPVFPSSAIIFLNVPKIP